MRTRRAMAWPVLSLPAKRAGFVPYLVLRQSKAGIRPAATVVLSAAFGAAVALLVAGPGLQAEPVTAGLGGNVGPFSANSPDASLAWIAQPTAKSGSTVPGGSSAAPELLGRDRSSADPPPAGPQASLQPASGSAAGQASVGEGSSRAGTQSVPEGTSEPPAGPATVPPVDEEEPAEEGPGEDGQGEEDEEPPAEEPGNEPQEEGDAEEATLCHKAGLKNAKTITVGADAVPSHLAHGDTLGACP